MYESITHVQVTSIRRAERHGWNWVRTEDGKAILTRGWLTIVVLPSGVVFTRIY